MMAQGMIVNETVKCQDNTSSMLLEKNGCSSSSKCIRLMNIRFFSIKECVDLKEFRIEYCPTGDMIADFFTKPLQWKQVYKLQDQVMNIDLSSKYHSAYRSVLGDKNERHRNEASRTKDAIEVEDLADSLDQLLENESRTNDVARMTYREAMIQGGE